MSNPIGIAGIGVLIAFLCLILRQAGFGAYRAVSLVGVVGMLAVAVTGIGSIVGELLAPAGEKMGELVTLVMRIIGVGYVFGICADICRDVGEGSVANAVLTVGRVEILLLSLPALRYVMELVGGMVT
ncbi:MAG: hypothetical protein IJX38_05350 [Clostridia bacterium]|nr:hypothetical protein [Clostridia bacterium]